MEKTVKTTKARRRERIIVSKDEEDIEDPSNQGRKIAQIDKDHSISLVQDEGTSWDQKGTEMHGRTSDDTEILIEQEEPTELVED
ncbi:hypothetical protein Tco_1332408 [Tanacetum coccineum]